MSPSPSRIIREFPEIMGLLKVYGWDENPPVSAGNYLEPNLTTLPAYALQWRNANQGDNKYYRRWVDGSLIVRLYHSIPSDDPDLGLIKVTDLNTAVENALSKHRERFGILRLNRMSSIQEPVPRRNSDVVALRTEFGMKFQ